MKPRQLIALLLAVLLLTAAFVSCQPTPDEPIVNAGDDSVLNDKIEATAVPTPVSAEENLRTIYGFPLKYQEGGFTCVDDDMQFTFDAEVEVPDVKAMPVYEAEASFFTADFAENFLKNAHPGVQFYEHTEVLTKSEVEEWVKIYQEKCAMSWDEFLANYNNGSEEDTRQYREQCEYCLEEYKKLLDTAPETDERIPADFAFHDLYGYYEHTSPELAFLQSVHGDTLDDINTGRKFIIVDGAVEDGLGAYLEVWSRFDGDVSGGFRYTTGPLTPGNSIPYWTSADAGMTSLSKDQAKTLADGYIEDMGLSDEMVMTDITTYGKDPDTGGVSYYTLVYNRGFGGIKMQDVLLDNDYDFVNGNENITITIMHNMVTEIEYNCPYETTKTENENVSLLSFDEILDIFKKQAAVEYTKLYVSVPPEEYETADESRIVKNWHAYVDKIQLVMVRIPKKEGGYRFVPAWQFRGKYTQTASDGRVDNSGQQFITTFMTINAIDGTRIAGMT